jgi:hypothetical protein
MISNRVIASLENNREKRLSGDLIAMPWLNLPRLSKIIPGVEKGKYYLISANPKGGKTQLADYLFVYEPIEWYLSTRPKMKLKIIYFSLEMSKESKLLQAISYKLNKDYDIAISPQHLRSTFKGYILDKKILDIIRSVGFQTWLKRFEEIVTYIDDVRSPDAIHRFVKGYAEKHGKYVMHNDHIQGYTPQEEEHIIVITDHLSLLSPDNGDTLHAAMYKYSAYHCLEFRDRFNYSVVNIQQQSADSGKQQFDYRGNSIVDKVRPTPDGLADMRLSSRDVNLMLSLFNPASYGFSEYEGVDLNRLGKFHRELFINLNRDGISNAQIQLYFNGAVNEFEEMPRATEFDETTYKYFQNKINKVIT